MEPNGALPNFPPSPSEIKWVNHFTSIAIMDLSCRVYQVKYIAAFPRILF